MITDSRGRIEYVNPKFTELTGYALDEVIGKNSHLLKSGHQPPEFYKELWEAINSGKEWRGEFCNKKKSGELYWESTSISPVKNAAGTITHFVALKEDITDRRHGETQERVLRAIREAVRKMRGTDDIQQVLVVVRVGLERLEIPFRLCGINVVEPSSDPLVVRIHDMDKEGEWSVETSEQASQIIAQFWRAGALAYRRDLKTEDIYQERVRDEITRSVLDVPFSHGTLAISSAEPNAFSTEDIASLQALTEVISEGFQRLDDFKTLEATTEQLRQAQKMEAIGQLAGGVAHDFNNLITVISGFSELLLNSPDLQGEWRQHIGQIKAAGDKAASLVRQLLAFSRRQVLQPVVLDLNGMVIDLEKMLRRLIGENIELTYLLAPELRTIHADPSQIDQVLINLVVNARDAMPNGGKITLETANVELDQSSFQQGEACRPGPYVRLAVCDTGTGIDPETQAHIFEPFFTTKQRGEGTGMGLSTVYGIVQQSNGYIQVSSETDKGTTFNVFLPLAGMDRKEQREGEPLADQPCQGTETILLVEDEEMVRNLIQEILSQQGYQLLVAPCGEEALQISRRHPGTIHLLLSDVVMPGLSGPEVAEQLSAQRPVMRTLFISGYADRAMNSGDLQEGMHFLPKPFGPNDLAQKVRQVLASSPSVAEGYAHR